MAEYKYECVKVRIHDGIAWASLNRPDKRNAMSPQLHYDMDDALARLEVDEDVRVVVVERRRRQLQRRPGPAEILPRARAQSRRAQEGGRGGQPLALGAALQLRQADHRHGARLLRRRRVHAAARLRLRDRRRGRDVLAVRGELGHPARRAGLQGGRRHGAAAPRALLRLPRRAVRRQGGRAHRHDQLRGAARTSSRTRSPTSPSG